MPHNLLKVLFVTGGSPWPITSGVNQRTHFIYKALSDCGQVDLIINSPYVTLDENGKRILTNQYRLIGIFNPNNIAKTSGHTFSNFLCYYGKIKKDWFGSYLVNKENRKIIFNNILKKNYNLIVTRYLKSALNTGVVKFSPIILDVDDLTIDILTNEIRNYENFFLKRTLRRIYKCMNGILEQRFLQKFDYLWLTKETDRNIVKNQNSVILPNIPVLDFVTKKDGDTNIQKDNIMLFIGSMKHTFNVEGIDRFIKRVWPKIKSLKKNAILRVVGSGMDESQKTNWNQYKGVQAVGFVENLAEEYKLCAFSIIPLNKGGGTKIKLIESLSYGRTCVVTRHSMRGYEDILLDEEDISIAENDESFITKCIKLLNNPGKRDSMAENGRKKVAERFTFNAFKKVVEETVNRVANSKRSVSLR
jgi:glycosyltransferase involved in cell wall biosynthesis